MKFLFLFLFALTVSLHSIAIDVASGQKAASSKSNLKPALTEKCPTTLTDWVEDDFKDKRAIYSWPMKSEAKTCQMNINSYGKTLAEGHKLDDYLSQKFQDKINPEYKNYFAGCNKLPTEKQSAIKVRFYESATKLEASSSLVVDEIAAIDAVLPNSNMLEGIECARIWPHILEKCEASKNMAQECSSTKQSRMVGLVQQTQQILPQIEALVQSQHACLQKIYSESENKRIGHGFQPEVQKKLDDTCGPIVVEINRLTNLVPWVRGTFFLKTAVRKKASPRNAQFATDYDLSSDTITKAITEQLTQNRNAYKAAYQKNRNDFSCLADKTDASHCDFKDMRTRLLAMPDLRQNTFDLKKPADREGNTYFQAENCLLSRGEDREKTKSQINGPIGVVANVGAFIALSVVTGGAVDVLLAPRAVTAGMSALSVFRAGAAGFRTLTTMQKGLAIAAGASQAHTFGVTGNSLIKSCSSELETLVAKQRPADLIKENVCPNLNGALAEARLKETNCFVAAALAGPSLLPFVNRFASLRKIAQDAAPEAKALSKETSVALKKAEEVVPVPTKKMPILTGTYDPHPQKVLDVARYNREAKFYPAGSAEAKKALKEFDEGNYVYVIDSKGNMAVVNREMKPMAGDSAGQNLGNHEGLTQFLGAKIGEKPEIVAAGDFIMRSGRPYVTNQSGNFQGTEESLQHAKEIMQSGGGLSELQVVNVVKDGVFRGVHTKAANDVNLALEYKANPELKKVWDETREVMGRYKDISDKEFSTLFSKDMQKNGIKDSSSDVAAFFGWWKDPREGEAWALSRILKSDPQQKSFDISRLKELLAGFRRIADQK